MVKFIPIKDPSKNPCNSKFGERYIEYRNAIEEMLKDDSNEIDYDADSSKLISSLPSDFKSKKEIDTPNKVNDKDILKNSKSKGITINPSAPEKSCIEKSRAPGNEIYVNNKDVRPRPISTLNKSSSNLDESISNFEKGLKDNESETF